MNADRIMSYNTTGYYQQQTLKTSQQESVTELTGHDSVYTRCPKIGREFTTCNKMILCLLENKTLGLLNFLVQRVLQDGHLVS